MALPLRFARSGQMSVPLSIGKKNTRNLRAPQIFGLCKG
jgi:hypothetical protein